jgi:mRNA interferase RelE/StbE
MEYQVVVPKPVQKQLDKLKGVDRDRSLKVILGLKTNPRPSGCVKLKRYDNEYRIRAGNYRIRYELDDRNGIVLLLHLKHRKDAYKT